MCKSVTTNYMTHYTSSTLDNKENNFQKFILLHLKTAKDFLSKKTCTMSSFHLRTKPHYPEDTQSKCETLSGTVEQQQAPWLCVCVLVCLWHTCTTWISIQTQMSPIQRRILSEQQHADVVSLVPVCRRIFHMRAWPHLSWTVSSSTEACRSSAMVWVLCRTSLSSCSCFRVSANSPCTVWSCPSRIWTRWTQLSLSASQRWSVSSRSATGRSKKEGKKEKESKWRST